MRRSAWGLFAAAAIAAGPAAAASRPIISVSPLSADCGTLAAGADAACEAFAVANLGFTTLHVTSVTLTGADAADFRVDSDACTGALLAMGGSCNVVVRFAPRTTGDKAAGLLIGSNDPDAPWWTAPLAGEAVPPPSDGGAPAPVALGLLLAAAFARRRPAMT